MNKEKISLYTARLLALLNIVMLLAVFCLSACYPSCGGDCAPTPGTTPDATSLQIAHGIAYYVAKNTLFALDDQTGKLLWKFAAEEINLPVISNGVVYVNIDYLSNPNNSQFGEWVYALQANDGKLLWHFRVNPYIASILPSPPQIIDGIVYAQVSGEMYGSSLLALRASDGKLLWKQNPPGNNGESVALLLATRGIAYVSSYSSSTSYVTARDASNGQQLWQYAFPHTSLVIANVLGNILYTEEASTQGIGGWGATCAFEADSGQLLWQSPYGGLLTVTQNAIYLDDHLNSNPAHIYALHPDTGRLLWQLQMPEGVEDGIPQLWTANTDAAFVTFGIFYRLNWYALAATNGKQLWHFPVQSDRGQQIDETSLFNMKQWFLSGNAVYLPLILLDPNNMGYDFELHALQTDTGKALWTFRPPPMMRGMAYFTIVQGVIYLNIPVGQPQQSENVWAIRAQDGKVLWRSNLAPNDVIQAVTQDGVYLTFVKGSEPHFTYGVIALNPRTGKQSWTFQA